MGCLMGIVIVAMETNGCLMEIVIVAMETKIILYIFCIYSVYTVKQNLAKIFEYRDIFNIQAGYVEPKQVAC